jgi:hydrogenase maturation protein HypF
MYEVSWDHLLVVHDAHPEYASTAHALGLPAAAKLGVQHHRAHLASVLAERGAWAKQVLGVSFDGAGYGDDGTIWGGEIFAGSLAEGFERVAHLRPAALPGGDAAAHYPVQAAAGFLSQVERLPDLYAPPFQFPERYRQSLELVRKNLRTFTTTSIGRLFDAAAALLGFTRELTFEGQGAMWLEHLARTSSPTEPYPFPLEGQELDFRPLLEAMMRDRLQGRGMREIARAFQRGMAEGLSEAVKKLCRACQLATVVLSGGVFQNRLLLDDLKALLGNEALEIWTNSAVPPNDGGLSLGQAAMAALARSESQAGEAPIASHCCAK